MTRSTRGKGGIARWLTLALLALGSSCAGTSDEVRIGSHDFTEQKILAEMMALLAENEGLRVERAIPYGDNRKSLQAIQNGVLDAYPEYDGTLYSLTGARIARDPQRATSHVRSLVKPLGLRWLDPFGLENGFAVAVRRDLAIRQDLRSISDLAGLEHPLDFAVDEGYLSRPVDGLYALARRYGLELGEVVSHTMPHRSRIYDALADRRVHAAEVFATDSQLTAYGVIELEDDLGFYPVYRAAPLVRAEVLDEHPELAEAWKQLGGKIDSDTMRRLNTRVDSAGEDYRNVARGHLEQLELLPVEPKPRRATRTVTLAITPLADLGYLPIRAAEALREVMPARNLEVTRVERPAEAVRNGQVRFGLVGAEEFFRMQADGSVVLEQGIEAVGVLGTRFAHLISLADTGPPSDWTSIGVGPEGSSTWRVAGLLLEGMGLSDRVRRVSIASSPDAPLDAVHRLRAGSVDALLAMEEQGHAGLVNLLRDPDLRVLDLRSFRGSSTALHHPFLRPARIPAGTYPNQPQAIETVSAQAVLATRVPPGSGALSEAGPGFVPGVFTRLPQRLPFDTARRISRALGSPESVDPLLPASPGLVPETPPTRRRLSPDLAGPVMNAIAVAFLLAMVLLYFKRLPANPDLPSSPEDDRPTDAGPPHVP